MTPPGPLKVQKLHPDARVPEYATDGAACFDIASIEEMAVGAGAAHTYRTGLAFEVPDGHTMLIFSRSGHGFKHGLRLANCVGVIDADYRGEVMVRLANDGLTTMRICSGDRIAQAMILPVPRVQIQEADDLTETERGVGGFGSTGK
jgi:dUTP pyrophosphatase